MTNPYLSVPMTEKQEILTETTDMLIKHQKSCKVCDFSTVCDIAAEINLFILKLVYNG